MSNINPVQFTSDLHLGHDLAARQRGFENTDYHDWEVIQSISQSADKRTVTWILGDVCMDIRRIGLLSEIPGRLRLVRGNHDNFQLGVYQKYFEEVHGFLRYKEMWLSHCPIHPQEMFRCKANVHGHIHKNTNSPTLGYPYINVNWDFWRKPVSLEELKLMVQQESDGGISPCKFDCIFFNGHLHGDCRAPSQAECFIIKQAKFQTSGGK